MSKPNEEVVHEGWLTKSPPAERMWRARWRKRWFTLRHSGELPGQYFLEYYTDRKRRQLKGTIDLDQCEQVDAGLVYEQKKEKYPFLFDVKTPSRTYYLAAESEQEMNNWVDCICQVCSLKADNSEDQDVSDYIISEDSPTSPLSGNNSSKVYIPIYQCISGAPQNSCNDQKLIDEEKASTVSLTSSLTPVYQISQNTLQSNFSIDSRCYDFPRKHAPTNDSSTVNRQLQYYTNINGIGQSNSPVQSPTDSESIFTDEEWTHSLKKSSDSVKDLQSLESNPSETDVAAWVAAQRFTKITLTDNSVEIPLNNDAPPRPPKPLHLLVDASHSYLNLSNEKPTLAERRAISKNQIGNISTSSNALQSNSPEIADENVSVVTDEMYDFPRSHQHNNTETENGKENIATRHCYNNAAPVSSIDGQVFRYDFPGSTLSNQNKNSNHDSTTEDTIEEPASPCSQSSCSTTFHSNLPSPLDPNYIQLTVPPTVNRGLKPGRTPSDTASVHSVNDQAPTVNRKLKPVLQTKVQTSDANHDFGEYGNIRKPRAAPSPILLTAGTSFSSESDQLHFHSNKSLDSPVSTNFEKLQYLDLDLELEAKTGSQNNLQPPRSPPRSTVYKTVDFLKTEAFNRTKQRVEAERKQFPVDQ